MAVSTINGKSNYWYDGIPCNSIRPIYGADFGNTKYWYNGTTNGFIIATTIVISTTKARGGFAVLVGF